MNKFIFGVLMFFSFIFIFIIGGAAGIFYQSGNQKKVLEESMKNINVVYLPDANCESVKKILSSDLISSITISGTAKSMINNQLVLSSKKGELLDLEISKDAKAYLIGKDYSQISIGLNDIKANDKVTVLAKMSPDGALVITWISVNRFN